MTVEVVKLHSDWALSLIRTIIHWNFSGGGYDEMSEAEYHVVVNKAQDEINRQGIGAIVAWDVREEIAEYCGSRHVMLQSGLYLRASRPGRDNDVVGWHRESFYGAPANSVNLWMPVLNVTKDNTLRYVPDTAGIDDVFIDTEQEESETVEQGSAGSKIGLLYAPKHITAIHGSNEFAFNSEPMIVPDGSVVLFPGSLIHGAAVNRSNKIRFSVDVRLLAREQC